MTRLRLILAIGVLLLQAGCVQAPSVGTGHSSIRPAMPAPMLSQAEITVEVEHLRGDLAREVPQQPARSRASDLAWVALAKDGIKASVSQIDHPQLIVVVDRNPDLQELRIILAQSGDQPWQVIGGSKVSTGQVGRYGYFITPTGVFPHLSDILDYRALGTFNEHHIRGLGLKGMRVWDFGWQAAEKGWLPDHEMGGIRLLMHATDPDYLEQRLGHPASEGCIRIPSSMDRFLDLHGVLDADYERAASHNARLAEILLPEREPTKLAGDLLVVVDSSEQ